MSEFYRCSICGNPMFAGSLCPKCSANGLKSCEVNTTNWQEQKTIAELQKRIDFVENKADQFNEGFQAARNGEPDRPIELEESNAWMEGYAYGAYLPMKQRIAELEAENKALRLIAGSHSMSELRRNQILAGDKWYKYPPAPERKEQ